MPEHKPLTTAERRARTAAQPKCQCGNVLGLERVGLGIKQCRACLPDERVEDRSQLTAIKYRIQHLHYTEISPPVREILLDLVDFVRQHT